MDVPEAVVKAKMEELDGWIDSMESLRERRAKGFTLTETQQMLLNMYLSLMGRIKELEDYIEHLTEATQDSSHFCKRCADHSE